MREIGEAAQASKDCARCGGRAFYWRSAVVLRNPSERLQVQGYHQPAWTCMNCGHIEPHERRAAARRS